MSTELDEENANKIKKKQFIKSLLSHDYDRQIDERNIIRKDEVRQNRSYAKIEEDYYKNYEEKRARDLARMLKSQKTATLDNPEYEGIIS